MRVVLVSLFTLMFSTGCFSILLSDSIRDAKEVSQEWKGSTLKGRSSGEISVGGTKYQRYEFSGFKDDPERVLEVRLPNVSNTPAIFLEHRRYMVENSDIALPAVNINLQFKSGGIQQINRQDVAELQLEIADLAKPQESEDVKPVVPEVQGLNEFVKKKKSPSPLKKEGWLLVTESNSSLLGEYIEGSYLSVDGIRYALDLSDLSYEERSRFGVGARYCAYIITVPLDIATAPILLIGFGIAVLFN